LAAVSAASKLNDNNFFIKLLPFVVTTLAANADSGAFPDAGHYNTDQTVCGLSGASLLDNFQEMNATPQHLLQAFENLRDMIKEQLSLCS
jgi:hypothetical protein